MKLLIITTLIGFILITACAPTKVKTAYYNPNETRQLNNSNNMGLIYYLPKKYLRLEATFNIFYHTKTSAYSDNRKPTQYEIIDEYAIISNVKLEEKILPDTDNAIFIRIDNAKQSGNDLDATVNISPEGFLTSIKTVSEGKVGQVLEGVVASANTLVRLGTSLATPNLNVLGGRGDEQGPNLFRYSVDSVMQTYSKLLEINDADTTIVLRPRDFAPSLRNAPDIRVRIMGGSLKNKIPENPLKSKSNYVEGVLYRTATPIRTRVEIKGNDYVLSRTKVPSESVVVDEYILYPQFGAYGIAQLNINGSGRQQTDMTFYPQGGLQVYSIDKKSKAEENAAQRNKVLQDLETGVFDTRYNLKNREAKRIKEAEEAELEYLESQLQLIEKRDALEQRKKELQERLKSKEKTPKEEE